MNQHSDGGGNPDALCKISLVKCTHGGMQKAHLLSQLLQNVRFGSRHLKPTFAAGRAHHLEPLQSDPICDRTSSRIVLRSSATNCQGKKMVRVAGVEPAWTCAQDMWVAATLHPDQGRGPFCPLRSIPSRRPPGATCVPRPPDRAALPLLRRWTCTPSEFHR